MKKMLIKSVLIRFFFTIISISALVSCVGTNQTSGASNLSTSSVGSRALSATTTRAVHVAGGAYGVISYSYDNLNWSMVGIPAVGYNSMASGESGLVVAVGESGAVIFSADNGVSWNGAKTNTTSTFNKVAYGNGIYIAVGDGGIVSRSGGAVGKWNTTKIGTSANLTGISYINKSNIGIWVVTTNNNNIFYSYDDGSTWSSTELDSGVALNNIKYANGEFYAVGDNGNIWHSIDGSSWVKAIIYTDNKHTAQYYGNITSVAFGNNTYIGTTADGKLISSTDGQVWVLLGSLSLKSLNNMYFNNNNFIVVGDSFVRASSDNGKTWREILTTTYNFKDVILTQDRSGYIFVAQKGYIVRSSSTFNNVKIVPTMSSSINSAQHSQDGSLIVAVGNDGVVLTSSNGQIWTKQNSATINFLKKIIVVNNVFIAVGGNGTIDRSNDGVNWTVAQPYKSLQFFDASSNGSSTVVAIGKLGNYFTSTQPAAALSSDGGKTWIDVSANFSSASDLRAITYNKDAKLFMVIDSRYQIFTSSDGSAWEKIGNVNGLINGLSYLNGTYVAVGENGIIAISNNGKNWSQCSGDSLQGRSFYGVAPSSDGGNTLIATGTGGALVNVTVNGATASCSLNNNVDTSTTLFDYDYVLPVNNLNVTSAQPSNNSSNVVRNTQIKITFDDALAIGTINNNNVKLISGSNLISATLGIDPSDGNNDVLVITPDQPLSANTSYSVIINQQLLNVDGYPLAADYTLSFTTAPAQSVSATLIYPANNALLPFDSAKIILQFSMAMDANSFNNSTISVAGGQGAQSLNYDSSNNQLTIYYSGDSNGYSFTPGASLSVSVNGVKNIYGDLVSSTLPFATAAAPKKWSYATSPETSIISDNVGASFIDSNESNLYIAYLSKQNLVVKKLNSDLTTWSNAGSVAVDQIYSFFPKFAIAKNGIRYFAYVNSTKDSVKLISCQNSACKLVSTYSLSKNGYNIGALDLDVNPVTNLPVLAVAYGPGNNNSYTNKNNQIDVLYYDNSALKKLSTLPTYTVSRKSLNIATDKSGSVYIMELSDGSANSINARVMRLNYTGNGFASSWQEASLLTLPAANLKGGNVASLTKLDVAESGVINLGVVSNDNQMWFYSLNCPVALSCAWVKNTPANVLNYTGTTDFSLLSDSSGQLFTSLISLSSQSATKDQIQAGSVYGITTSQWVGQSEFSVGVNYLSFTKYNDSYFAIASENAGTGFYYTVYRYKY